MDRASQDRRRDLGYRLTASAERVEWYLGNHEATLAMRPDVMVLAARYGHGHLRAAKAVTAELLSEYPDMRTVILDYYQFVNPRLDHTIRWAYLSSVRFAPRLWHWFYTSTQRINPEGPAQSWMNRLGMEGFYRAVRLHPPAVVLATFPTAAGMVSTLKQRGWLDVVNMAVVTDYAVHSQWIHPFVDTYFVGSEEIRQGFVARGIDPRKVVVSGIPVDRRFRQEVDMAAVRRALGLGEEPLVLFMGGDYMPTVHYVNVLKALDRITVPHTTLITVGEGSPHREEAEALAARSAHRFIVRGFVDNVHELMAAAAVLVSKAGGLTTTEALCRGVPTVIYRPIPGQEDANAAFVVRHGAGIRARSAREVGQQVEFLLRNPERRQEMARRALALGHPDSAQVIARAVWHAYSRRRADAGA